MEYPLNEAQDFLTKNKENAQVIIDNIVSPDLIWLKGNYF
jgi:hypothetical protein